MRTGTSFFQVRILPNLCSHFLSQSFQHTPLKILVNFESGVHVFSGVLCRNAWYSTIHIFIIWFTDILDNLNIQENCKAVYTSMVLNQMIQVRTFGLCSATCATQ